MNDYKGIYYNNSNEQQFYEGGAHFKYSELYKRLLTLANREHPNNDIRQLSKDSSDYPKKKIISRNKQNICSNQLSYKYGLTTMFKEKRNNPLFDFILNKNHNKNSKFTINEQNLKDTLKENLKEDLNKKHLSNTKTTVSNSKGSNNVEKCCFKSKNRQIPLDKNTIDNKEISLKNTKSRNAKIFKSMDFNQEAKTYFHNNEKKPVFLYSEFCLDYGKLLKKKDKGNSLKKKSNDNLRNILSIEKIKNKNTKNSSSNKNKQIGATINNYFAKGKINYNNLKIKNINYNNNNNNNNNSNVGNNQKIFNYSKHVSNGLSPLKKTTQIWNLNQSGNARSLGKPEKEQRKEKSKDKEPKMISFIKAEDMKGKEQEPLRRKIKCQSADFRNDNGVGNKCDINNEGYVKKNIIRSRNKVDLLSNKKEHLTYRYDQNKFNKFFNLDEIKNQMSSTIFINNNHHIKHQHEEKPIGQSNYADIYAKKNKSKAMYSYRNKSSSQKEENSLKKK